MKNASHNISWIAIGVGAVAIVSGLMTIPVWKQNRYQDLMRDQTELQKEQLSLASDITEIAMENASLRAMTRIEPIAKSIGLGYHAVPIKVMEIPHVQEGAK